MTRGCCITRDDCAKVWVKSGTVFFCVCFLGGGGLVSAPMILQRVIRLLIIIIIIIVTCRLEKNQPCILMHSYGLNTTPSTKKCKCPRDDVVFYKLVTTSGFSLDISGVKFFWERKQDDLAQMYFYLYFYHNLFHLFTVMAGGMSAFLNGAAGYLHEDE